MNTRLAAWVLAVVGTLQGGIAAAAVDAATARTLMVEAGLWDALDAIPSQLKAGVQAGMAQAAGGAALPEGMQRVQQALEGAFTVERTRETALKVVSEGLDPETVAAVRQWNASPTGTKLRGLDQAAAGWTDAAKVMAEGQAALAGADDARRAALGGIVEASRAADALVEITLNTTVAMLRGVRAIAPPGQVLPSDDQLRAALQVQMAAAKETMQASLITRTAAAYATCSTSELREYEQFMRSPAGQQWNALNLAAVGAVLRDGAEEMGRRLAASTPGAAAVQQ